MNDHFLDHLARERQAEFRREAEMNRKARMAKTRKPIATRWNLSLVIALAAIIIILLKSLG